MKQADKSSFTSEKAPTEPRATLSCGKQTQNRWLHRRKSQRKNWVFCYQWESYSSASAKESHDVSAGCASTALAPVPAEQEQQEDTGAWPLRQSWQLARRPGAGLRQLGVLKIMLLHLHSLLHWRDSVKLTHLCWPKWENCIHGSAGLLSHHSLFLQTR